MTDKKCTTCIYAKFKTVNGELQLSKDGECTVKTPQLPHSYAVRQIKVYSVPLPQTISKFTLKNCPLHESEDVKMGEKITPW